GFAPYLKQMDDRMIADLRSTWDRFGLAAPDNPADMLSVNDPATADWPEDRFWDFLHEFHVVLDLDRPIASTTHLVDAIDHAVNLIGIDHVGISSDFNHGGGLSDWRDVGESINVTAALLSRGYAEDAIAKLWGENFLRTWQAALDDRVIPKR
ncbi:MAG TPA: membrane dipeptidase, partial [Sphingobium sp.]|uniref:membrane dipeptidase n=1 Tax=Sphingobium sp. TaxID=1912891 RepID=UPI002ED2334E